MAIVSRVPFNRRTRFILTAGLAVGYGATLVPTWFAYVFTYEGNNRALRGFYDAIVLVMETGFAVTAFVTMILNLMLPHEIEDTDEAVEGDEASSATQPLPQGKRSLTSSSLNDGDEITKVEMPPKEAV